MREQQIAYWRKIEQLTSHIKQNKENKILLDLCVKWQVKVVYGRRCLEGGTVWQTSSEEKLGKIHVDVAIPYLLPRSYIARSYRNSVTEFLLETILELPIIELKIIYF